MSKVIRPRWVAAIDGHAVVPRGGSVCRENVYIDTTHALTTQPSSSERPLAVAAVVATVAAYKTMVTVLLSAF